MSIAEIQRKADAEFEREKKMVEATGQFTTADWYKRGQRTKNDFNAVPRKP